MPSARVFSGGWKQQPQPGVGCFEHELAAVFCSQMCFSCLFSPPAALSHWFVTSFLFIQGLSMKRACRRHPACPLPAMSAGAHEDGSPRGSQPQTSSSLCFLAVSTSKAATAAFLRSKPIILKPIHDDKAVCLLDMTRSSFFASARGWRGRTAASQMQQRTRSIKNTTGRLCSSHWLCDKESEMICLPSDTAIIFLFINFLWLTNIWVLLILMSTEDYCISMLLSLWIPWIWAGIINFRNNNQCMGEGRKYFFPYWIMES